MVDIPTYKKTEMYWGDKVFFVEDDVMVNELYSKKKEEDKGKDDGCNK